MRWLPSTWSRYATLGIGVLAVLSLLDATAHELLEKSPLGFGLVVSLCWAAAFAWLLIEPLIDNALLARHESRVGVINRVTRLVRDVALNNGLKVPRVIAYPSETFSVTTVGIGRTSTIFFSTAALDLDDELLRSLAAHELGHIECGHAAIRGLMYGGLLALVLIFYSVPMLAMAGHLLALHMMRRMEYEADRKAADLVGRDALGRLLDNAACRLGDIPRWQTVFSTHPSFRARRAALDRQI